MDDGGYMDPEPPRIPLEEFGEEDPKNLQAVDGGQVNIVAGSGAALEVI